MAQAGRRAAVMLHRAADEALAGLAPSVTMVSRTTAEMQGYIDLVRDFEPKDAPYLGERLHHGLAKRSNLEGSATTAPSCNSRPTAARMSSVTNGQVYDRA